MARKLLWASLALAPITFVVDFAFHPGDVALFVLAVILNGLIMFGVEPALQQVIVGAVLVSIVVVDTWINREEH